MTQDFPSLIPFCHVDARLHAYRGAVFGFVALTFLCWRWRLGQAISKQA